MTGGLRRPQSSPPTPSPWPGSGQGPLLPGLGGAVFPLAGGFLSLCLGPKFEIWEKRRRKAHMGFRIQGQETQLPGPEFDAHPPPKKKKVQALLGLRELSYTPAKFQTPSRSSGPLHILILPHSLLCPTLHPRSSLFYALNTLRSFPPQGLCTCQTLRGRLSLCTDSPSSFRRQCQLLLPRPHPPCRGFCSIGLLQAPSLPCPAQFLSVRQHTIALA